MLPHPDNACEVGPLQRAELLAEAARFRRAPANASVALPVQPAAPSPARRLAIRAAAVGAARFVASALKGRWGAPLGAPRPSSRTLATLALVVPALLWGTSFVAAKGALATIPPVTLTLARFVVALAVLAPLARRAPGSSRPG